MDLKNISNMLDASLCTVVVLTLEPATPTVLCVRFVEDSLGVGAVGAVLVLPRALNRVLTVPEIAQIQPLPLEGLDNACRPLLRARSLADLLELLTPDRTDSLGLRFDVRNSVRSVVGWFALAGICPVQLPD